MRLCRFVCAIAVALGCASAFAQAPANDHRAAAQIISGASGRVTGTNVNATKEPGEISNPFNVGGRSIWYAWTATSTESVRFDTVGTGFDTILAVYATNASGVFALIGAQDNPNTGFLDSSGGYLESRVNLAAPLTVGRTFFIAVDGFNSGTGALSGPVILNWNQLVGAPANDSFSAATALTGSQGGVSGRNHNGTKQNGEPNHAGNPGGRSVWFSWTAPAGGDVVIDTMGSTFDTLLAVYTGGNVNNLTLVAQNDDAVPLDLNGDGTNDSAFIFFSRVTFAAVSGTTYRIAVDGHNEGIAALTGSVSLHYYFASAPPANNDFASASVLTGAKGQIAGSNLGASKQSGEPDHATSLGGRSVWYQWTAPASGQVTFDTFGRHFDSVLAIYTGGAVNALTSVAVNDDVAAGVVQLSRASFAAAAGTVYHIAVDGWASAGVPVDFNPFTLNWELAVNAPTNDLFVQAQTLPGSSGSVTTSNTAAVFEQFEPLHGPMAGKSLWFRWTAPRDRDVTLDTAGSAFDTLLAVYGGNDFFSLTNVAFNDDADASNSFSRVTFAAAAGATYHVAVDGYNPGNGRGAENGLVVLNWLQTGQPPLNDHLTNAFLLAGLTGATNGASRDATTEPGEPDRGPLLPVASSWYRWTAPVDGWFTFDTAGGGLDTVLAVYEGTTFGLLFEAASNDNIDDNNPALGSRATFRATAGTAYSIAVDGGAGAQGDFTLRWAPAATLEVSMAGANLHATLRVAEGGFYTIESSTDLVNWTDAQTVDASSGAAVVDLGPLQPALQKFHRARR